MQTTTRPNWLTKNHFPFESRFLTIDDSTIHYIDEGAGPTLLFLHANPGWSFTYRKIIKALTPQYRCIALDYPDFGLSHAGPSYTHSLESMAKLVEIFIKELDLTDITIIGHDMSASVAAHTAQTFPKRITHFVMSNGFLWPYSDFQSAELTRGVKMMASPFGKFLITKLNIIARAMINVGYGKLSDDEKMIYRHAFHPKRTRAAEHALFGSIIESEKFLQENYDGLATIKHLPTLLLWGAGDPTDKADWHKRVEKLLPNTTTRIIPGGGHFPQETVPKQMMFHLTEWLS